MKQYTATVDAPHAELGKAPRTFSTTSVNALTNAIVGIANEHPDEPFTFTITATEIHEG